MDRVCGRIVRLPLFQRVILGAIFLAIALVGLETDPAIADRVGWLIRGLDRLIVLVFVVEAALKILAHGDRPWRYFWDPWNAFDFLILACLLLPFVGSFVVLLRVGRLLRILRLVTTFPRLRMLISTLFQSLPSMGYILMILGLLFYVYGVAGTFLFGANDPIHFGSLAIAMLSLFTVVTLEGWTTIMYIQMYGCDRYGYDGFPELCTDPAQFPLIAPVFFISFVLMGAMVVLNLFVGVIISSMMASMDELEGARLDAQTPTPRPDGGSVDGQGRSPLAAPDPSLAASLQTQLEGVETKLNTIQTYIQALRREVDALAGETIKRSPPPESSDRNTDRNTDEP